MREGLTRSVNCLVSAAYADMRRYVRFLSGGHEAFAPIAQLLRLTTWAKPLYTVHLSRPLLRSDPTQSWCWVSDYSV
jgi:hypothetical protein